MDKFSIKFSFDSMAKFKIKPIMTNHFTIRSLLAKTYKSTDETKY